MHVQFWMTQCKSISARFRLKLQQFLSESKWHRGQVHVRVRRSLHIRRSTVAADPISAPMNSANYPNCICTSAAPLASLVQTPLLLPDRSLLQHKRTPALHLRAISRQPQLKTRSSLIANHRNLHSLNHLSTSQLWQPQPRILGTKHLWVMAHQHHSQLSATSHLSPDTLGILVRAPSVQFHRFISLSPQSRFIIFRK